MALAESHHACPLPYPSQELKKSLYGRFGNNINLEED
jgi:hypothetical protein